MRLRQRAERPCGFLLLVPCGRLVRAAILTQLERALSREEVVSEAITEAFNELDRERPRREEELKRIEAEMKRTENALGRYFAAFESGTIAERDSASGSPSSRGSSAGSRLVVRNSPWRMKRPSR